MASLAKPITFFFLVVFLSSSVQIQARQSKFFSKIFHLGAKISPQLEATTPLAAPAPAPAPLSGAPESQDPYYGLYGHGQGTGLFPPAKETGFSSSSSSNIPTSTTTFEDDLLAEELAADDEKYETGYEKINYNNNNGYTTSSSNYNNGQTLGNYNNNGYNTNYNTNGYGNGYSSSNYNNGQTLSNYNNNEYETERQGMSDTRFVEGGKYYYDVKNENYYPNNGYESGKGTTENEGYFGNAENSNEFNSMEEFQNKENQYKESQEEYVP
ncbi:protein E6-like protein [Corchorus capsularis]|uniref:Protein E6-like protein n=1 Tax=Corchorus capsularis TaxID=210143 RepID=A0A1R3G449_COCAP|nr:protein E6-like protein [Corchorus capsularis]